MAAFFHALGQAYRGFLSPPTTPAKRDGALRFGLLGASAIAPMALITPAKSHAEVIIAAVAARDRQKAEAYAKKHNIPITHSSYQELIDDPSIDCIYIALPNGLHYEWALRSIKAGKHVLLEKPSCSNGQEARTLFRHPLVTAPNAPILLEAFHYLFHPAWRTFLSFIHADPSAGRIKYALSCHYIPKGIVPPGDIRVDYQLAGGALMDFGTYNVSCLRQIFGCEPEEVTTATYRPLPPHKNGENPAPEIDEAIYATYRFPGGATGEIAADMVTKGGWPKFLPTSLTKNWPAMGWPKCVVEMEEKVVSSGDGETHGVQRTVTLWNHTFPVIYHRIDVHDTHTVRQTSDGAVLKTWDENREEKSYTWSREEGEGKVGETWWPTYRYQLEEFVNRVKGRKGSGAWVGGEDSIKQMEMIDMTYEKTGLPLRPTSEFSL